VWRARLAACDLVGGDVTTVAPVREHRSDTVCSTDSGGKLAARLRARTASDPDYWTFVGNDKRSHGHALFSYPAMMVPQLQGALMDDLLAVDPTVGICYDPFGGSGTVLTECMRRGLDFVGSDLNPLAVLIMSVKARPLSAPTLEPATQAVLSEARRDTTTVGVSFRGIDKWFNPDVIGGLSALRRGIAGLPGRDTRRFLWVCLAETVRLVSNSRTSTFKLHAYAPEVLEQRAPKPLETFERVAAANTTQVSEQREDLAIQGRLEWGRYVGSTAVLHADMLDEAHWPSGLTADWLMTSPPYGDNRTTVPYGQHAYLPLMWIDRADLPRTNMVDDLLGSPYRTDVASLGGRRNRDPGTTRRELSGRSEQLANTAERLSRRAGDGLGRFLSFCADLDAAIDTIGPRLRRGAVQFWTLGDRRISGLAVPTSRIVAELSASRGTVELTTVRRRIPNNAKRMALRNDTVPTMAAEDVLVLQTAAAAP